ncbi:hypothetical protein VCHA35O142_10832 [Vibrio chagasii]|nr:hypothetical protein VCHA35O142_10832 [Vibrio chagasii]CAH7008058.1 hypothetical protein VCHA34P112_40283 [Vibrio chagasii]CAH7300997.1 hypothetical protein VCHA48P442_30481 [Vibrio chagasii]
MVLALRLTSFKAFLDIYELDNTRLQLKKEAILFSRTGSNPRQSDDDYFLL